ncbi:Fe(3+) dicitrate ABC transporter substrate-binding protein FecB [Photorhabdus bodei]|uniref:Fe(3+) dicitrate ABC transporter substrate-binding protein FecB n=1 Tax=Photorhabdus bodei TaxID=2029681 RepID=A0AAW6BLN1_9GAMM|nr:Fe(3+) dicitrate ABC transporter substrate-binding protein FecB [Photorhabdus bodei]MDB6374342.1 Fe(3+) dicitrate ABC transporter substrate-binding protein FecB [Photorhabdus bodei]
MLAPIHVMFIVLLFFTSLPHAIAVTVQDEQGSFTLNTVPQRVVVLELSFVDALAAINISPVGIADDNDPQRILTDVRQRIKPWQSTGTRAQPSLEAISALKPDLIIADSQRHAGIYRALKGIAPVLLLKSRNETYEENLQSAAIIGKVMGKESEMQQRLAEHRERMKGYANQLPQGVSVVFGTSREQQFNLHSSDTYTGSVLTALGLKVPAPVNHAAMASLNLEQLLALNPDWLIVAHYRQESIVKRWQQDTLWQMITAQHKHQITAVDSNTWARMRGIFAAERIGSDAVKIFHHQPVNETP